MIFICHVVAGIEFLGSFHLNSLQATINENRLDLNGIGWDFGFAAVLAVCVLQQPFKLYHMNNALVNIRPNVQKIISKQTI